MRCTNSEPGTFNHECGKPAEWIGTHKSGHEQAFCYACRRTGWEARLVVSWRIIPRHSPADTAALNEYARAIGTTELTPAGEQFVVPGCELNASPRARQLNLFG